MKSVKIEGQVREDLGKKSTKQLRRSGHIPCVVYGGDEAIHFAAPSKSFKELVYTPTFKSAEIVLDNGKGCKAILKDLQFHPVTDELMHIDFLELIPGKEVKTEVPIKLEGLAVGVRAGGKLLLTMRRLKVRATPENLQDVILVNVEELELGKSIKVKEVEVEGMEILNPASNPIAMVEIPRALKSEASKEEAEGETEGGEEGEKAAE